MLEGRRVSGDKIRQFRLKAGMSQFDLAHAVGVSERNIVRWETGRNQPRLEHLVRLADALGVGVLDLMEGDGPGRNAPTTREARLTAAEAQTFFALLGKAMGVEVLA